MRLGKTLVVIRRLLELKARRVLVVGPSSVLGPWLRELELERERDVALLLGPRAKRLELLQQGHRWNLLNREGFRVIPEIANVAWDAVVCDESVFLKNPQTQVSQFFGRSFTTAKSRWLLTGKPNPESELEFFQQFKFLTGGMLGFTNFYEYRARLFHQYEGDYEWIPWHGSKKKIRRWVAEHSIILRRSDVPGMQARKVYEQRQLELPPKLRRVYDKAEKEYFLECEEMDLLKPTKYAVSRYAWLRQMCGGFLDGELVWMGKMQELVELLCGELRAEPVVVWFAFNDEIRAAHRMVKSQKGSRRRRSACIVGPVPVRERISLGRAFQSGEIDTLLCQVACADTGVDFSRADTAIYYSGPTSGSQRGQSEDRILVPGGPPLLYLDLVVKDSVDEDVFAAAMEKDGRSTTMLKFCQRLRKG